MGTCDNGLWLMRSPLLASNIPGPHATQPGQSQERCESLLDLRRFDGRGCGRRPSLLRTCEGRQPQKNRDWKLGDPPIRLRIDLAWSHRGSGGSQGVPLVELHGRCWPDTSRLRMSEVGDMIPVRVPSTIEAQGASQPMTKPKMRGIAVPTA